MPEVPDSITEEFIIAEMIRMVTEAAEVQKKLKSLDLFKNIEELYGAQGADRKMCKNALKATMNQGKLVYTYFGGSFVELPHKEGAAND